MGKRSKTPVRQSINIKRNRHKKINFNNILWVVGLILVSNKDKLEYKFIHILIYLHFSKKKETIEKQLQCLRYHKNLFVLHNLLVN